VAGSLAMMPVGQALAGPVAQLVGLHSVLLINGAISAVGCVVLMAVPAIRGLVRVSAPLERVG
jgi:hypothetical protein